MSRLPKCEALSLLKSQRYSDFTIKCGEFTFKVHRLLLYSQSEFFERCFDSGFKEAHEATLTFNDINPVTCALMILFAYTREGYIEQTSEIWPALEAPISTLKKEDPDLYMTHIYIQLHEFGDYLMYPHLKSFGRAQIMKLQFYIWMRLGTSSDPQAKAKQIAEILDDIYTKTREGEDQVRRDITDLCVKNYTRIDRHDVIKEVIEKHQPCGWSFGLVME